MSFVLFSPDINNWIKDEKNITSDFKEAKQFETLSKLTNWWYRYHKNFAQFYSIQEIEDPKMFVLSCRRLPDTYISGTCSVSRLGLAKLFSSKKEAEDWYQIYRHNFDETYDVIELPETKTMNYRLKTHAYIEAIQITASTPLQELVDFFEKEGVSIYKTSKTELKISSSSWSLYPKLSNWIVRAKDTGRLSIIEDSTFRAQYESC